jgi:hypothetical protein
VTGPSEVTKGNKISAGMALNCNFETARQSSAEPLFKHFAECSSLKTDGVTDGTRTRNSQNHNLELYH